MRRWLGVMLVLPVASSIASPVFASVGGPEVAEVLGWDPADRKVFVAIHFHGDSGISPLVLYFNLSGGAAARPQVVSWSRYDARNDSGYRSEFSSLRRRLKPLREETVPELPRMLQVSSSTISDPTGMSRTRYVVRGRFHHAALGTEFEAVTYDEPSVHLAHLFSIPNRNEKVMIVSFRGIPYEEGYECQVPVLVSGTGPTSVKVEWKRW